MGGCQWWSKRGILTRERIKGCKIGNTSLFDRFIVDKTHRVLIFNHSFDELSFSQSLCEEDGGEGAGGGGSTGVTKRRETLNWIHNVQCGVKKRGLIMTLI